MLKFNIQVDLLLSKCGINVPKGLHYEQYIIQQKNNKFYILEDNIIRGTTNTLREAKELCDTINSGC